MNTSGELNKSVRNTKRKLKEGLMELLGQKPLSQVSVKELVQKADVNRGTFYFHYKDVYALVKEIEENFLCSLNETLDAIEQSPKSFTSILLKWLSENEESCRVLLGPNGDSAFLERIREIVDSKCVEMIRNAFPTLDKNELCLVGSFMMGGVISVLKSVACNEVKLEASKIEAFLNGIIFNGIEDAVSNWQSGVKNG